MEPSDSTSASNRPQGEGDSDHSEAEEERLPEGGREDQEEPRPHETDNLAVSWASATFDADAAAATRVAGELSSTSPELRSGNRGTSAPGGTPDASHSSSTSRKHGGERDDGGGNRERLSRVTERQVVTYEDLGIFAQQPKRPDLVVIQIRINTFDQWPHQDSHPADQMAEAGFYYTGHQDLVRCFFCNGGLKTWERSDQPWVEHCRWFPRCPFVCLAKGQRFVDVVQTLNSAANQPSISEQQVIDEVNRLDREERRQGGLEDQEAPRPHETDNLAVSLASATFDAAAAESRVELSSTSQEQRSGNQGERGHVGGNRERSSETERQQPKRPDLAEVRIRTNTFQAWPHQNTHPADQMVEAGFYYEGHSDLVRCFHCGGGLRTWQKENNPWVEHKRFFPHCSFIREKCRGQAPQSEDDIAESDHALRQNFKTPVHESRAEAARECDHPVTIRPAPLPATQYKWSENGLAVSGSPPIMVSSAQAEPALGVVDPDQAAAVPLAGRLVLSERGLWALGAPPVQDQVARCLHCGEKERELLQDCGHRCLCHHCFFCPYFWNRHLDCNQGVMVCLECGRPFHSISISSLDQLAAGRLNARHRRFTCCCLSRRG